MRNECCGGRVILLYYYLHDIGTLSSVSAIQGKHIVSCDYKLENQMLRKNDFKMLVGVMDSQEYDLCTIPKLDFSAWENKLQMISGNDAKHKKG